MLSINENTEEAICLPHELCELYEDKKQKIGSGSFSNVLLAEHKITGELVAVKVMNKKKMKKENNLHRFYSEVDALKTLVHQNICQLYQVFESEDYLSLVLEHCSGGELFDYIVSKKRLKESEARRLFREMISAISFIHENGYAHRDIKPENMLLSYKKEIKIIDFGLSIKPANGLNVPLMTRVGSPAYAAPELVSGEMYFGNETDIWSLGIVLYAVLCGFLPFDEETTDQLYESIKNDPYRTSKRLSKESERLLEAMLQKNPKKRISMDKLLEHEWVTNCNEYLPVTSKSTICMTSLDSEIVKEVANVLEVATEAVIESLSKMQYDDVMACYLLLSKKKKNEIWKFNQIFGLQNNLAVKYETQGIFSRPRSKTENKECLGQKMRKQREEGKLKATNNTESRDEVDATENQTLIPLLSVDEINQKRSHSIDRNHGRSQSTSIKQTKLRSGTGNRINEFLSLVFKHEEKPRKAKGFYHMANTSTKPVEEIQKELHNVLKQLCYTNYIENYTNTKPFVFRCTAVDKDGKMMSFELEICAIPNVENVLGIRNKRMQGDVWFYKEVIERIFLSMKL